MNKAKRIVTLVLCFVLVAAAVPAVVWTIKASAEGPTAMLSANETMITVSSEMADGTKVLRIPSYETYSSCKAPIEEGVISNGTLEFARYADSGMDKIYETFYFVDNGEVLAGPLYVTQFPALNDYARPETTSIKGLQVQNVDDAEKLGVQHAALNFNLNTFFYESKPSNENNIIEYVSNGKTFYIRKDQVEDYDTQIKTLYDSGMEVTLIMIVWGWQGSGITSTPKDFVHPGYLEALANGMTDPIGRIAAVNTTNQAGVEYWIAAMEFVAERYTREDAAYGRAVNFVISNEVDCQVMWNCMGEMPMEEYVNEYSRTFRLAYNAVMKKYANASVLISLDHAWNVLPLGSSYSDQYQYPGRDVFDLFAKLQKQWGDIGWNVAYHPYPENLFDPEFWHDTQATDNVMTTPRITFKNIELLPEYLAKEEFLYNGETRHIMLTEQGFHTTDPSSIECQKVQAAAYAYAYYKLQFLEEIDAFILHRHVDMDDANEDGLKLGLWTVKEGTAVSPHVKKYIWDVFKYIDTDKSEAVTEFAKEILGITDWRELIPEFDASKLDAGTGEFNIRGENGTAINPQIEVSDFETDTNGWEITDYANSAQVADALFAGPYTPYAGNSSIQITFGASEYNGGGLAEKGIVKRFNTPLDLSGSNYNFVYAITAPGGYASNATLTTTVRFYSGKHVAQMIIPITADQWNTIRVDISNWEYKDSIDKIKIWVETNTTDSYGGKFALDNVGFEKAGGNGQGDPVDPTQPTATVPTTTGDPNTPTPSDNRVPMAIGIGAVVIVAVIVVVVLLKKKGKKN